jgi:ribosomal protein S18 acetylase RimI-like enzyme
MQSAQSPGLKVARVRRPKLALVPERAGLSEFIAELVLRNLWSRESIAVKIRVAQPSDSADIASLHTESWRTAYRGLLSEKYLQGDIFSNRRRHWDERFRNPKPGQYAIVAEDEAADPAAGPEIIGFACAFGNEDPKWGTLLDNLHVLPSLKRQGIGTQLTANIAAWCKQTCPARGMYLYVFEGNSPARKFYERLGGIDTGEVLWTAPDGNQVKERRFAWSNLDSLIAAGSQPETNRNETH